MNNNPFEAPSTEPPKPAAETPSQELPTPVIEVTPEGTQTEQLTEAHPLEIPEHLQPPKLTPAERAAAIDRLNHEFPAEAGDTQGVTPFHELTIKQQKQAARLGLTYEGTSEPPEISVDRPDGKSTESIVGMKAFYTLAEDFETKYSLEALYAITDITPAEIVGHPLRRPAANALIPIRKIYDELKNRSDIPVVRRDEMERRYAHLSRAVGIYNGLEKRVDHDRI